MQEFKNHNVIVTGGIRGIGKGIALAFLYQGANVLLTYANNDQIANDLKKEYSQFKNQLFFAKFNIADAEEVEKFYKNLPFEELDVLINNAGIRKDQIVGMMPISDWDEVISVNLNGSFYMSKFAIKEMMKNHYGRIINITSPCSYFGFQGQANYAASKAGQIGLMRSLSKETAKKKITVNCVSPGFIETEFISDLPENLIKKYKQQIPMKRFGQVEDVANAILFLASLNSSYITGITLEVTGGL